MSKQIKYIHQNISTDQRQVFVKANFNLIEQDFIEIKNQPFELNKLTTT